jgi:hypothetical protein
MQVAVTLNRMPAATVRLPVSSSDPGEGRLEVSELVFEPADWNTAHTLKVTGVDDAEADGNQSFQLVLGASTSADPAYAGIDPPDVTITNTDNEYQTVGARSVSGTLDCSPGRPQIAADVGGRLYVVMSCFNRSGSGPVAVDGGTMPGGGAPLPPPPPTADAGTPDLPPGGELIPGLFVVSSADGGRSFSAPLNLGRQAFDMRIAGSEPGTAVLAFSGPAAVMITRTGDGGLSWSPPAMFPGGGGMRLGAGGRWVVLAFNTDFGPALAVSEDGGRSFNRRSAPRVNEFVAAAVDGTTGAITLVSNDGSLHLHRSTDGGVSFGPSQTLPASFVGEDSVAVGGRSLFSSDKDTRLAITRLDDLTDRRTVDGLPPLLMFPRVLVADAADNLAVLDTGFNGIELRRLAAGQTSFSPARTLARTDLPPGGALLSDRAVAAVLRQGGQVLVGVEVFEGP